VLKLDYEKANDKVNLEFLYEVNLEVSTLRSSVSSNRLLKGGSVGVKVNVEGDFFLTGKGLTQWNPIAPLLFNCIVDVFSGILVKGTEVNLISGLCPTFLPGGVVSL
jgi:hypothetical protein